MRGTILAQGTACLRTTYRPIAQLDPLELAGEFHELQCSDGRFVRQRNSWQTAITATVRKVDPDLAVMSRPMQAQIAGALNRERLLAVLSGFLQRAGARPCVSGG